MFSSELHRRHGGFTMVELMITLVILAVLVAVAVPGFRDLIERNRIQTAADGLFTSLMLTRSEALKRNQVVIMCKSSNGTACTSTSQWEQGWLVYVDADSDSAVDPNEILRVEDALQGGHTLRVAGGAFNNEVSYRTDGTASGAGAFVFCNARGELDYAREVEVAITGRPRLSKSTTDCSP